MRKTINLFGRLIGRLIGRTIGLPINRSYTTYDQIQSMVYLDQVIHETLRLYSGSGYLERTAAKDYNIPGHNLVIEKGTQVWMNKIAIHRNQKYFENPNEFNPDHFSKEAKQSRHQ